MASLTVRQLDDKLKTLLRLRAARQGRSMEDEVRVILRQAAEESGRDTLGHFEPPQPAARQTAPAHPPHPSLVRPHWTLKACWLPRAPPWSAR